MRDPRARLIALLTIDGAGVGVLAVLAAVTRRPAGAALAAAAGGGWLLALGRVPRAVTAGDATSIRSAERRVLTGAVVTVAGAAAVCTAVPPVRRLAQGLVLAGSLLGAAYARELTRLRSAASRATG